MSGFDPELARTGIVMVRRARTAKVKYAEDFIVPTFLTSEFLR